MKWRSLEETASAADTRSLREIFAERKGLIAKYVPPETQATHSRVIAELQQQRVADRSLGVGAKTPLFELKDHNGDPVFSTGVLSRGLLVICFFRGRLFF